jgi:hypothetical protein
VSIVIFNKLPSPRDASASALSISQEDNNTEPLDKQFYGAARSGAKYFASAGLAAIICHFGMPVLY